jgi:hypothetical protein
MRSRLDVTVVSTKGDGVRSLPEDAKLPSCSSGDLVVQRLDVTLRYGGEHRRESHQEFAVVGSGEQWYIAELPAPETGGDDVDDDLARVRSFRHQMCACDTYVCGEKVQADLEEWGKTREEKYKHEKPSDAMMDALREYEDCYGKLKTTAQADPTPVPPLDAAPDPAPAPAPTTADDRAYGGADSLEEAARAAVIAAGLGDADALVRQMGGGGVLDRAITCKDKGTSLLFAEQAVRAAKIVRTFGGNSLEIMSMVPGDRKTMAAGTEMSDGCTANADLEMDVCDIILRGGGQGISGKIGLLSIGGRWYFVDLAAN